MTDKYKHQQLIKDLPSRTKLVDINLLKKNPKNAFSMDRHHVDRLKRQLEVFGYHSVLPIDKNHHVIGDYAQVLAYQKMGIDKVAVIIIDDLSEAQIQMLSISLRALPQRAGTWNKKALSETIHFIQEHITIELPMLTLEDTGLEYGLIEEVLILGEEQEIDAADARPNELGFCVSQMGDVWQCGKHVIKVADSTQISSYQDKADVVISDLPYNLDAKTIGQVAKDKHGDFAQGAGELSNAEFTLWLENLMRLFCQFSKDGSLHYLFMSYHYLNSLLNAGDREYSRLLNICTWIKDRAGQPAGLYRPQTEFITLFQNGNAGYLNNVKGGKFGRYRTNAWQFPSVRNLDEKDGDLSGSNALLSHPTVKPVKLIEEILLDCTKRGDTCLDPFLGSGSTLIACEKQKRICHGIEIEPKYVDVAIRRWQDWTGKEAINQKTGATFNQQKDNQNTQQKAL